MGVFDESAGHDLTQVRHRVEFAFGSAAEAPVGLAALDDAQGFADAQPGRGLAAGVRVRRAVGVLGALKSAVIERWLSSTFGFQIFNRDIYLFDHMPSEVTPIGVGRIVLGAVASTLLFAAIPAWRASRLDPVDALRHE